MGKVKFRIPLNLLMGIRFSQLIKYVFKYGIGFHPKYIIRFLFLIPTSMLVEFFILIEKIKFGKQIKRTIIKIPPVFILGHWRSGTTFLHQLISLDHQFTAPTVIQSVIPEHFLFSSKYWMPVLKILLPKKRPMDEIEMKPLAPFEDEWALIRMGSETPLLKVFFPTSRLKFMSEIGEFLPEGKNLLIWQKNLLLFLKKITLQTQKQVVIKNPFHTPRLSMLADLFPGARIIHIVRHPYRIIPSAINTWNIVAHENAFKEGWKSPSVGEVADLMNQFWNSVTEHKNRFGVNEFTEIRYEDLENNPVKELKRIYDQLNLPFTAEFENNIIRFLEENKHFKKNKFTLSQEEKTVINDKLKHYFHNYHYNA